MSKSMMILFMADVKKQFAVCPAKIRIIL